MKQSVHSCIKITLKTILILIIGTLLGTLLLTAVYFIPVNEDNFDATAFSADLQGWYPNVPSISNAHNTYFQTYLPGVMDNATVRTYMLPMTFEPAENPLYTALNCRGYNYYWHGYVIILRVLQYFMNYEQIQMANYAFQITLIVMLAVLIGRQKNTKYVLMLASSYALMMPMALGLCLQYYAVFNIAFTASVILLYRQEFWQKGNRLFYGFLVIGMLTSYFDLLTFPLITWGIPLVWWLVMDSSERSIKESLKRIVTLGISWIAGYGGMWAGKWIIATIVLQKNIIQEAILEIVIRSGVDVSVAYGLTNRFYSLYTNWLHYNYILYIIILVSWLIYWLICGLLYGWKRIHPARALSYLLVACSSFVWYIVVLNHTEIHHAFTYRIYAVTILAFMALVLESTSYTHKKLNFKRSLRFIITGVCLVALAIPSALCSKEISQVDNKNQQFETRIVTGQTLEIQFIPQHDRILALCVGLLTDSTTGVYELTLYNGNEIAYTENIPVEYYKGKNYRDYIVDWHLTPGQEYRITIDIRDTDADVYAYYTADGFLPLAGCCYYENGVPSDSQPLIGIQYWCRSASLKTLGLLALTYWGMYLTIYYVISCCRRTENLPNKENK